MTDDVSLFDSENEIINRLVGKRKRDTFEDMNVASLPIVEELLSSHDHSSTTGDSQEEGSPSVRSRKSLDSFPDRSSSPAIPCLMPIKEANSGVKKRVKREGGKPAKVRIPLKDIRRNFVYIFARAFNTCDREILAHCLNKYCIPECVCTYKYVGITSPYGPDNVQIMGIEAISEFWEVLFLSMPDSVMEIQENKIRVLQNGSCASVSKFIFSATKVYKMSVDNDSHAVIYKLPSVNPEITDDASVNSSHSNDDSKIVVQNVLKKDVHLPSEPNLEKSVNSLNLNEGAQPNAFNTNELQSGTANSFGLGESLEKPQVLIIIGTFTIFVNPDKKIYKFEFVHSIKP